MITIELCNDHNIILDILKNPLLYKFTYGQDDSLDISDKKFLIAKENEVVLGCFEIRDFTKKILEAHISILPKHWLRSEEMVVAGIKWAQKNHYTNIITSAPKNCGRMFKFLERIRFNAISIIPNGIVYNGQLVDLFIFAKNIEV